MKNPSNPTPSSSAESSTITPETIKQHELERILVRRRAAFLNSSKASIQLQPVDESKENTAGVNTLNDVVGLAISGGGLRSATFNDGFIAALSHRGLLRYVDYISSVSGGGYITGHLLSRGKQYQDAAESSLRDNCASSSPPTPNTEAEGNRRGSANNPKGVNFFDASVPKESSNAVPTTDNRPTDVLVESELRPSDLGISPSTQRPVTGRFLGVGNYLASKSTLVAWKIFDLFVNILVYIGIGGMLATLVALVYRMFDYEEFRELYLYHLRLGLHDELGIAFIPTTAIALSCGILYLFGRLFAWDSLVAGWFGIRLVRVRELAAKTALVSVVLAFIASVAIFFGNGYTRVQQSGEFSTFSDFAVYLGATAALAQIMIFFGKNRLLRSEKQNAKQWQRISRSAILYSATALVVFFGIYFMGRENLSGYATNRGAKLHHREVTDWPRLLSVVEELNSTQADKETTVTTGEESILTVKDMAEVVRKEQERTERVEHVDQWDDFLAVRRLVYPDENRALVARFPEPNSGEAASKFGEKIDSPAYQFVWWRLAEIPHALGLALFDDGVIKKEDYSKQHLDTLANRLHRFNYLDNQKKMFLENFYSTTSQGSLKKLLASKIQLGKRQDPNPSSPASEKQTEWGFLGIQLGKGKEPSPPLPAPDEQAELVFPAEAKPLEEALKLRMPRWGKSKTATFTQQLLDEKSGRGNENLTDRQVYLADMSFNRDCLRLLYPNAFKPHGVVSTPVVVDEDQKYRCYLFWWFASAAGLGLVLSASLPNRSLYDFYRESIAKKFLTLGNDGEDVRYGDQPLSNFDLTPVGLPLPLINCAEVSIEPSTKAVKADLFLFSPLYSGSTQHGFVRTDQYRAGNNVCDTKKEMVKLKDTICISGAALTPLMSSSVITRIMLDFFDVNLGRYLVRPCKLDDSSTPPRWKGYGSLFANKLLEFTGRKDERTYFPVADGGFADFLGVMELLERRCRLIIVSDAGLNSSGNTLGQLARMLETAEKNLGVRFYDLDHDAPIDFERLSRNPSVRKRRGRTSTDGWDEQPFDETTTAPQHYVSMRIDYPGHEEGLQTSYLFYAQMIIGPDDPLEIKQVRDKFPNFPDEPTTNQFFTQPQVEAYQRLGYYIGQQMCAELEPWSGEEICDSVEYRSCRSQPVGSGEHIRFLGTPEQREVLEQAEPPLLARNMVINNRQQPLFETLLERLLQGYRMACFREKQDDEDVFSEAIWESCEADFPRFYSGVQKICDHFEKLLTQEKLLVHHDEFLKSKEESRTVAQATIDYWMRVWERNADVRNAYREAVFHDINLLNEESASSISQLYKELRAGIQAYETNKREEGVTSKHDALSDQLIFTLHIAGVAMACQQFHTGWMGKVFQVGGRRKLISLLYHIGKIAAQPQPAKEKSKSKTDSTVPKTTNRSDRTSNAACSSIAFEKMESFGPSFLELQTCVYRAGGKSVVVSFAVCLAISLSQFSQDDSGKFVLSVRWAELSDFISRFSKSLEEQSRTEMSTCLRALCDSITPKG